MKQVRYIITRPCLQEGSLSLLKYLDSTFPESGPATLVDDRGREYAVEVDRAARRVWGLRALYHEGNLGVNDVLLLTPQGEGRYAVETVVKPHASPLPGSSSGLDRQPEARRVVINATPHVREVRMEQVRPQPTREQPHRETPPARENIPAEPSVTVRLAAAPEAGTEARTQAQATANLGTTAPAQAGASTAPVATRHDPRPAPRAAAPLPTGVNEQLTELARLTGYRLTTPAPGIVRLAAELGTHGYTVQLALSADALREPAWREGANYRLLVLPESERPQGVPRLTREALGALIEHARLAPLSPLDLHGYWKAGNLDLESAASISELVGAHLAQRGAFSFVLLTLAAHPAHSVITVSRLAERLGSGVNLAELQTILDTLTRTPFLALTPLPGGQYLLRADVRDLLADLAEYAEGVRRRVRTSGETVGARV
ncbi:hypothetical protein [Deinococcus hopiensis]|nr:hypothetical protein [Deinococcus hopiensis]